MGGQHGRSSGNLEGDKKAAADAGNKSEHAAHAAGGDGSHATEQINLRRDIYPKILDALGITDRIFGTELLDQLRRVATVDGRVQDHEMVFFLDGLKALAPKTPIECLLAAQVLTAHCASMRAAHRLALSESFLETEYTEKAYTKLARTFALLVESFDRHRAGPRPGKIVVKSEPAKQTAENAHPAAQHVQSGRVKSKAKRTGLQ